MHETEVPLGLGGVCVLEHERIALVAAAVISSQPLFAGLNQTLSRRPCRCTPAGCAAVDGIGGRGSWPWLRPKQKSAVETDLSAVGLGEAALALCGESVNLVLQSPGRDLQVVGLAELLRPAGEHATSPGPRVPTYRVGSARLHRPRAKSADHRTLVDRHRETYVMTH